MNSGRFLAIALSAVAMALPAGAEPVARFTDDGALVQPEGYREWVFIGAAVVPQDIDFNSAYAPGIKHTYIDPESFAHWKKTGRFRDGTVIAYTCRAKIWGQFDNPKRWVTGVGGTLDARTCHYTCYGHDGTTDFEVLTRTASKAYKLDLTN